MNDQNTRPQPSAEPVAEWVWQGALSAFSTFPMPFGNNIAAAAVIASALEAARREGAWEAGKEINALKDALAQARAEIAALKENLNAG